MQPIRYILLSFFLFPILNLFGQDTIRLNGDTIRVGELEWDIEKQWPMKKDWITKNPDYYGDDVLIFHRYYSRGVIEHIGFGYMSDSGFVLHGPTRYYYPTGELLGKRTYDHGKLEGDAKDFYRNRRTKMIATFTGGRIHGPYISFYDDGSIESRAEFQNGEQIGVEFWYYSNGVIKEIAYYEQGKKQGKDSTFYETGDLQAIYSYDEGELDGPVKFFHRNGKPWTERVYEEGKLEEVNFLKSAEGRPVETGNFQNGNGKVNVYSDGGKLIGVETYKNGQLKKYKQVKDKRLGGKSK